MFQVQLEENRGRDPKLKIAKSTQWLSAVARVTAKTCSKNKIKPTPTCSQVTSIYRYKALAKLSAVVKLRQPHRKRSHFTSLLNRSYISLYFVPGLLKRQNLKFCIYFLLSNIHNMFRHSALITWYLIYDWQKNHNRSQKKQTQLSLSTFTFQRKWEPSPKGDGKNLHPSGVSPFLWLTDPSPPSSSWPLLAEFKNSSLAFPSRASRSGLAGLPLIARAMVAAELPHDT